MTTFELSSKKYKNGRRKFTATLYELQPPSCVVDDIGTMYNDNGITFLEEYAKPKLDSIRDMSVRVSFTDDARTLISDHGMTGIVNDMPVFENATTVGHFTKGFIDDVLIDGELKRCVCGEGYIDEMCYPAFVKTLEKQLQDGTFIMGSIEIFKVPENSEIIYKNGMHDENGELLQGRIPTEYIHSGWDMVLNPSDKSSTLLELNSSKKKKKEENKNMEIETNELKQTIQDTICEINSKNDELSTTISELNEQVAEKDKNISELNATVEQLQKALTDLKNDQESYWEEKRILEKELAKAKVAEKLGELDSSLAEFNEAEKKVAEDDIEELKKNINACEKKEELNSISSEINSIKSKICMAIVAEQKKMELEAKTSELNSKSPKPEIEDIFSEICDSHISDDDDTNIF